MFISTRMSFFCQFSVYNYSVYCEYPHSLTSLHAVNMIFDFDYIVFFEKASNKIKRNKIQIFKAFTMTQVQHCRIFPVTAWFFPPVCFHSAFPSSTAVFVSLKSLVSLQLPPDTPSCNSHPLTPLTFQTTKYSFYAELKGSLLMNLSTFSKGFECTEFR